MYLSLLNFNDPTKSKEVFLQVLKTKKLKSMKILRVVNLLDQKHTYIQLLKI